MPVSAPQTSTKFPHAHRLRRKLLVAALFPLVLAACAPDAWRQDDPFEAFFDRVQNQCQNLSVGRMVIRVTTSPDAYFLDLTSRFYHGKISRQNYVDTLESFYDAPPGTAGVTCILAQMPY